MNKEFIINTLNVIEAELNDTLRVIESSCSQEIIDATFKKMLVLRSQIAGLKTQLRVVESK